MKLTPILVVLSTCISIIMFGCKTNFQKVENQQTSENSSPKIIGAMKNAMHKGEIAGIINIDTITNKQHLYGLGPIEFLTGEIMLINGKGYTSMVVNDTTMKVTETFAMKAPFFGYANIDSWTEKNIHDSIITLHQLETFLDHTTKDYPQPYFFKLTATVDSASVHIVNLPKGTKVSTPEEAHQGQRNFTIKNKSVELLGFFSTEHKAIFTHHDTFVHIHLMTDDRQQMGHLEQLNIKKGTAKLYLPKQ